MWRTGVLCLLIGLYLFTSAWTAVVAEQIQDGIPLNSVEPATRPGKTVEAPAPDEERVEARFVAKVKWIEAIGKRKATVVPIGVDPRWLVGIEVRSVDKAAPLLDKKGEAVLAIHSPVRLFAQPREKVPGKSFSFQVTGQLSDGRPKYLRAQATEKP